MITLGRLLQFCLLALGQWLSAVIVAYALTEEVKNLDKGQRLDEGSIGLAAVLAIPATSAFWMPLMKSLKGLDSALLSVGTLVCAGLTIGANLTDSPVNSRRSR